MKIRPEHLADLCRLLRAAGLQVTADHELKLQTVFRAFPEVDGARARRLVAPVVLTSTAQAEALEAVLDRWLPSVQVVEPGPLLITGAEPIPRPTHAPTEGFTFSEGSARPGRLWIGVGVLLFGLVVYLAWPGEPLPGVPLDAAPPVVADAGPPADAAIAPTGTWRSPRLTPLASARSGSWWPGMALIFGLAGVGLLLLRRRDDGLPADLPPPSGGPVAPPARARAEVAEAVRHITDLEDRRALVWGVDHFLSEEAGRNLDLKASVKATARAADRPVTVYERTRKARAIWLWIDADAESDEPERLAAEVRATLESNGLEVHLAWFAGVPDVLHVAGGGALDPEDLGTPPHGSVVAVLTDGRAMTRVEGRVVWSALAGLTAWPRLAVVDFAGGATELSLRLRPHGVPVIAPEALARWLGGEGGGAPRRSVDLTSWLAACALSPTPVDPADALALGRVVGIRAPARHLALIEQDAQQVGGRLAWPWHTRAARLDWLGRQPDLLQRAVDQWTLRHAPGLGDTATDRARAVERAFVQLWTQPDAVAELLYAEPSQRARVEEWLGGLDVATSSSRSGVARVPWTWAEVTPRTRTLLEARGFGGEVREPERAPRPWWAIGACATVAAVGLVALLAGGEAPGEPVIEEVGARPDNARLITEPVDGEWRVTARVRQGGQSAALVEAGGQVRVEWAGEVADCRVVKDGWERWVCLDGPLSPRPALASGLWREMIIYAPATGAAAGLGRRLLETGAADAVVFSDDRAIYAGGDVEIWEIRADEALCANDRACVVGADFAELAAALGTGEWKPAPQVWSGAKGKWVDEGAKLPARVRPEGWATLEAEEVGAEGSGTVTVDFKGAIEQTRITKRWSTPARADQEAALHVRLNATYAGSSATATLLKGMEMASCVITNTEDGLEVSVTYARGVHPELARRVTTERPADGVIRLVFPPWTQPRAWMEGDALRHQPILFDFDESRVRADAAEILKAIAELLTTDLQDRRVEVVGHTSSKGSLEYNLPLSQKLAESAKKVLVGAGVAKERIITTGRGEEQPIAPNTTEEGRARNRRVEVFLRDPVKPEPFEPTLEVSEADSVLTVSMRFAEPVKPNPLKPRVTKETLIVSLKDLPLPSGWKASAEGDWGSLRAEEDYGRLDLHFRLGELPPETVQTGVKITSVGAEAFRIKVPLYAVEDDGEQRPEGRNATAGTDPPTLSIEPRQDAAGVVLQFEGAPSLTFARATIEGGRAVRFDEIPVPEGWRTEMVSGGGVRAQAVESDGTLLVKLWPAGRRGISQPFVAGEGARAVIVVPLRSEERPQPTVRVTADAERFTAVLDLKAPVTVAEYVNEGTTARGVYLNLRVAPLPAGWSSAGRYPGGRWRMSEQGGQLSLNIFPDDPLLGQGRHTLGSKGDRVIISVPFLEGARVPGKVPPTEPAAEAPGSAADSFEGLEGESGKVFGDRDRAIGDSPDRTPGRSTLDGPGALYSLPGIGAFEEVEYLDSVETELTVRETDCAALRVGDVLVEGRWERSGGRPGRCRSVACPKAIRRALRDADGLGAKVTFKLTVRRGRARKAVQCVAGSNTLDLERMESEVQRLLGQRQSARASLLLSETYRNTRDDASRAQILRLQGMIAEKAGNKIGALTLYRRWESMAPSDAEKRTARRKIEALSGPRDVEGQSTPRAQNEAASTQAPGPLDASTRATVERTIERLQRLIAVGEALEKKAKGDERALKCLDFRLGSLRFHVQGLEGTLAREDLTAEDRVGALALAIQLEGSVSRENQALTKCMRSGALRP